MSEPGPIFDAARRSIDADQWNARADQASGALRRLGLLSATDGDSAVTGLDLLPHWLGAEAWADLEGGLKQRAQALQALVRDSYGERRIVASRVIPADLVLGNERFLRDSVGLPVPENLHVRVAAIDVARAAGRWQVIRDVLSLPGGLAMTMQVRRTCTQSWPELFDAVRQRAVGHFTTQLIENVRRAAGEAPSHHHSIVLLSGARSAAERFEHSFLARKMGILVAQAQDLIVRDGAVFFKSVEGLQPVQVVVRAIPGAVIDPVTFQSNEGVAGLMSCLRKGTVAVVNGLGCGMAEHRGLLAFSDKIIRFYLNEAPKLAAVPTRYCADPDVAQEVREGGEAWDVVMADGTPVAQEAVAGWLDRDPLAVVAHRRMNWERLPLVGRRGELEEGGPFTLRCFVLCQEDEVEVLPGGLTTVWEEGGPIMGGRGQVKDTWVEKSQGAKRARRVATVEWPEPVQFLGSRVAEMLFWTGRYCERGECTARVFRVLNEIRIETSDADMRRWYPLWDALSRITGHRTDFFRREVEREPGQTAGYLVFDEANPSSVRSCLDRAVANAEQLQDFLSPEAFGVINELAQQFRGMGGAGGRGVGAAVDLVLNQLAAFYGMIARTMMHDAGGRFFYAGMHVERSLLHLAAVRQVFQAHGVRHFTQDADSDEESPLLAVLLRVLGTQDAYRRTFQGRAQPQFVAELLLREARAPVSLLFCAKRLMRFVEEHETATVAAHRLIRSVVGELEGTRLSRWFGKPSKRSGRETPQERKTRFLAFLAEVQEDLENLTEEIATSFFLHESVVSREFESVPAGEGGT